MALWQIEDVLTLHYSRQQMNTTEYTLYSLFFALKYRNKAKLQYVNNSTYEGTWKESNNNLKHTEPVATQTQNIFSYIVKPS